MPTVISTHEYKPQAESHLWRVTEPTIRRDYVYRDTYRRTDGRVFGLRLGVNWELVEYTAAEGYALEADTIEGRADDLDEQATILESRRLGRESALRIAAGYRVQSAELRAKAAGIRAKAEALGALPAAKVA